MLSFTSKSPAKVYPVDANSESSAFTNSESSVFTNSESSVFSGVYSAAGFRGPKRTAATSKQETGDTDDTASPHYRDESSHLSGCGYSEGGTRFPNNFTRASSSRLPQIKDVQQQPSHSGFADDFDDDGSSSAGTGYGDSFLIAQDNSLLSQVKTMSDTLRHLDEFFTQERPPASSAGDNGTNFSADRAAGIAAVYNTNSKPLLKVYDDHGAIDQPYPSRGQSSKHQCHTTGARSTNSNVTSYASSMFNNSIPRAGITRVEHSAASVESSTVDSDTTMTISADLQSQKSCQSKSSSSFSAQEVEAMLLFQKPNLLNSGAQVPQLSTRCNAMPSQNGSLAFSKPAQHHSSYFDSTALSNSAQQHQQMTMMPDIPPRKEGLLPAPRFADSEGLLAPSFSYQTSSVISSSLIADLPNSFVRKISSRVTVCLPENNCKEDSSRRTPSSYNPSQDSSLMIASRIFQKFLPENSVPEKTKAIVTETTQGHYPLNTELGLVSNLQQQQVNIPLIEVGLIPETSTTEWGLVNKWHSAQLQQVSINSPEKAASQAPPPQSVVQTNSFDNVPEAAVNMLLSSPPSPAVLQQQAKPHLIVPTSGSSPHQQLSNNNFDEDDEEDGDISSSRGSSSRMLSMNSRRLTSTTSLTATSIIVSDLPNFFPSKAGLVPEKTTAVLDVSLPSPKTREFEVNFPTVATAEAVSNRVLDDINIMVDDEFSELEVDFPKKSHDLEDIGVLDVSFPSRIVISSIRQEPDYLEEGESEDYMACVEPNRVSMEDCEDKGHSFISNFLPEFSVDRSGKTKKWRDSLSCTSSSSRNSEEMRKNTSSPLSIGNGPAAQTADPLLSEARRKDSLSRSVSSTVSKCSQFSRLEDEFELKSEPRSSSESMGNTSAELTQDNSDAPRILVESDHPEELTASSNNSKTKLSEVRQKHSLSRSVSSTGSKCSQFSRLEDEVHQENESLSSSESMGNASAESIQDNADERRMLIESDHSEVLSTSSNNNKNKLSEGRRKRTTITTTLGSIDEVAVFEVLFETGDVIDVEDELSRTTEVKDPSIFMETWVRCTKPVGKLTWRRRGEVEDGEDGEDDLSRTTEGKDPIFFMETWMRCTKPCGKMTWRGWTAVAVFFLILGAIVAVLVIPRSSSGDAGINNNSPAPANNSFSLWIERSVGTNFPSSRGDGNGFSVSISGQGNRLAVGSPYLDTSDLTRAGLVSLYEGSSMFQNGTSTWTLIGKLYGNFSGEEFGVSVALNEIGDILSIGSLNSAERTSGGSIRIYQIQQPYSTRATHHRALSRAQIPAEVDRYQMLLNYTITQLGQTLQQDDTVNGDFYGLSSSLSSAGDVLAVGAPKGANSSGRLFAYTYNNVTDLWSNVYINNAIGAIDDNLGWSVAISGDGTVLAAGAPGKLAFAPSYVNLYNLTADSGSFVNKISSNDAWSSSSSPGIKSDDFGFSVSLDYLGRAIAIGAPNSTHTNGGLSAGYAAVFFRNSFSGQWSLMGGKVLEGNPGDTLGYSVALSNSGRRVLVGSPNTSRIGAARIYNFTDSWQLIASLNEGSKMGSDFGSSVSINAEGTRCALGVPFMTACGGSSSQNNISDKCNAGNSWIYEELTPA